MYLTSCFYQSSISFAFFVGWTVNKFGPSKSSKDRDVRIMGHWINDQQINAKRRIKTMKSDNTHNKWTKFIEQYSDFI